MTVTLVKNQVFENRGVTDQGRVLSVRESINRNLEAFATTTNTTSSATSTAIAIPVSAGDQVLVVAMALGVADDNSKSYALETAGMFTRPIGGNVAAVGSAAPTFTAITSGTLVGLAFSANTSNQTVDVTVGGGASLNVNWTVSVRYMYSAHATG